MRQGMPEGWGLYRAATARSDEEVRNEFPSLAFPHSVRLRLLGGIRAGRRNSYFRFGVPVLLLEGGRGDESVYCNGVELQPDERTYHVPPNAPANTTLPVEVRRGEEVLKRQSFSLIEDFDWRWRPRQLFDGFGGPLDTNQPSATGVAGALLVGMPPPKAMFSPPPSCFEGRRVFFVGTRPGQIVSWPSEDLPEDWDPVWAIPLARRGQVTFCGTNLQSAAVAEEGATTSYGRQKVRLWKEVLHYRRKKVDPPVGPTLQRLWKQYQEVARRVRA
jgi:hypothetical protein